MTAPSWKRFGAAAAFAVVALIALFAIHRETNQRERDRRALLRHVAEMEKIIRAHDTRIWLHVEGGGGHPSNDPAHEAVHQAMLRDFERLAHLRDFAMRDVEVEIAGDTAVVRYRVEGRAVEGEPPPVSGEIRFARSAKG